MASATPPSSTGVVVGAGEPHYLFFCTNVTIDPYCYSFSKEPQSTTKPPHTKHEELKKHWAARGASVCSLRHYPTRRVSFPPPLGNLGSPPTHATHIHIPMGEWGWMGMDGGVPVHNPHKESQGPPISAPPMPAPNFAGPQIDRYESFLPRSKSKSKNSTSSIHLECF